jgi:PAS domain S-box-containing protein
VVRDDGGEIMGTCAIVRDIGERLRDARAKQAILDSALDAIVTIDGEGTVVEFNPAAEAMFGYAKSDAVGRKLADLIVPERLREDHRGGLARHLETGEGQVIGRRVELPALRRDGEEFPAEVSIVRLKGADAPLFTGFIRDLTRLKDAQRELESTIQDLQRSNHDLEQFAYVASHDLQEPLRMVVAYMDLLNRAYAGALDERADRYIHYAVEGAQRMKVLIDNLLAYSRIESRGEPLARVDCGSVVERALDNLRFAVEEAGATIDVGEDLPSVLADETQLEQVFVNLVGNALKFRSPAAPRVSIAASRSGDHWEFRIEDNGIGFEEDQAERIFQMFQRLHDRKTYGGSGIGLALARRTIERHGGRIWARSKPGKGSTFYFTLPAVGSGPSTDAAQATEAPA